MKRELLIGDNLPILRRHVAAETVDLVYLDPPFKSDRSYNMLFTERHGLRAAAQIKAFEDTWTWDKEAEAAYHDVLRQGGEPAEAMIALRRLLRTSDMMAYLAMMAVRLLELKRVLKPTGSIYLHCDPTASHYLKLVMDAVFGPRNFRNEIVWQRFSAKNDSHRYGRSHDVVLFYTMSARFQWHVQHGPFQADYVRQNYRYVEADTGRRYRLSDLTANKPGGDVDYEWRGMRPYKGRHWAFSKANMDRFLADGRIVFRRTGMPVYKRYLDEMPGVPLQDVWTDIKLDAGSKERIGYQTQKPAALLRRILLASSSEGDLVLDPFCGCGTAIVVAEQLRREWIGIDITDVAYDVITDRFRRDVGDVPYLVRRDPRSLPDAVALAKSDRKQFEVWAVTFVGGTPEVRRGRGDRGIDGRLLAADGRVAMISVKSGKLAPTDVRDLRGVVVREQAAVGVLISVQEPTRGMKIDAATAGVYDSPEGLVPRIQLLTVGQLFESRRIVFPPATALLQSVERPTSERPQQFELPLLAGVEGGKRGQLPIETVEAAVPWALTSPPSRRPGSRAMSRRTDAKRSRRQRSG